MGSLACLGSRGIPCTLPAEGSDQEGQMASRIVGTASTYEYVPDVATVDFRAEFNST